MNQEELIKTLKSILVWIPSGSVGHDKLKELILRLGGKI
jgi:hypothetical protein